MKTIQLILSLFLCSILYNQIDTLWTKQINDDGQLIDLSKNRLVYYHAHNINDGDNYTEVNSYYYGEEYIDLYTYQNCVDSMSEIGLSCYSDENLILYILHDIHGYYLDNLIDADLNIYGSSLVTPDGSIINYFDEDYFYNHDYLYIYYDIEISRTLIKNFTIYPTSSPDYNEQPIIIGQTQNEIEACINLESGNQNYDCIKEFKSFTTSDNLLVDRDVIFSRNKYNIFFNILGTNPKYLECEIPDDFDDGYPSAVGVLPGIWGEVGDVIIATPTSVWRTNDSNCNLIKWFDWIDIHEPDIQYPDFDGRMFFPKNIEWVVGLTIRIVGQIGSFKDGYSSFNVILNNNISNPNPQFNVDHIGFNNCYNPETNSSSCGDSLSRSFFQNIKIDYSEQGAYVLNHNSTFNIPYNFDANTYIWAWDYHHHPPLFQNYFPENYILDFDVDDFGIIGITPHNEIERECSILDFNHLLPSENLSAERLVMNNVGYLIIATSEGEDRLIQLTNETFGCTDGNACNFNPNVTTNDCTCMYIDCFGECGGEAICGCMDELAENYNSDANFDDGSCNFLLPEISVEPDSLQINVHSLNNHTNSTTITIENTGFDTLVVIINGSGDNEIPLVDENLFTYGSEFENHYYFVSVQDGSWTNARSMCEQNNGHLVTISSSEENNFVRSLVYGKIFLGLTDEEEEGDWSTWITGEPVEYTNWNEGEPNNNQGNEDYSTMLFNDTWNDIPNESSGEKAIVLEIDDYFFIPDWFGISDTILSIPAGESRVLEVFAEGEGYTYGGYEENLQITTNDPLNPLIEIPVTMNVLGPEINIEPDSLQFNLIQNIDSISIQSVSIENTGYDTLIGNIVNRIPGNALSFDGNDYVNTNIDYSWSVDEEFSISFWIKPTNHNDYQGIMGKGSAGGYGDYNFEWAFRLANDGNIINFQYYAGSSGIIYVNTASTPNEWQHICVTYSNNIAKIYKNGIFVASDEEISGNLQNRPTPVLFGHTYYVSGDNRYFYGDLDEIQFWDKALTEAEIQEYMYGIPNPEEQPLLTGYWKLEEGIGNSLENLAVPTTPATIYGATWIETDIFNTADWLTIPEIEFVLSPDELFTFDITAFTSELDLGSYSTQFTITSNDPLSPLIEIPVSMEIVEPILGCMDQDACNFNVNANVEDESCIYSNEIYDCDGICFEDADNDLICDSLDQYPNCADDGVSNPYDCLGQCNGTTVCDVISLSYGNNLISFSGHPSIDSTALLLETLEEQGAEVNFLIGQGVGLFKANDEWTGNLNEVDEYLGYWLNLDGDLDWSIPLIDGYSDICTVYNLTYGNNLISYLGINNANTVESLGGDMLSNNFEFILGQGMGLFNTSGQWSGNLNNLENGKGYWLNSYSSTSFSWGIGTDCEMPTDPIFKELVIPHIPEEYQFVQSINQAFYLINEIVVDGKQPKEDNLILAYHDDILVGSAVYNEEMTTLPIMGRDLSEQTIGFLEDGEIPTLKLVNSSGESISLEAKLEGFHNLLVSEVSTVIGNTMIIPTEWSLAPAYPNPFNPTTTIEIGVPEMVESLRPSMNSGQAVTLQVFDINGRLINTLFDGHLKPGFHTIEWDATGSPSGVYFVKLDAGEFSQTQKMILVK